MSRKIVSDSPTLFLDELYRPKSPLIKKYAKKHGLKVVEFKLSKTPVLLDEFNIASSTLQEVCFKLMLGRDFSPTLEDWLKWAAKRKIHAAIRRYVSKHQKDPCVTARMWANISDLFKTHGLTDKDVSIIAKYEMFRKKYSNLLKEKGINA